MLAAKPFDSLDDAQWSYELRGIRGSRLGLQRSAIGNSENHRQFSCPLGRNAIIRWKSSVESLNDIDVRSQLRAVA